MSDSSRTITESEFQKVKDAFTNSLEASVSGSLRAALEAIGFTIVPDPTPEPVNGEIVQEAAGPLWMRNGDTGLWENLGDVYPPLPWFRLRDALGPLRIFAEVKS